MALVGDTPLAAAAPQTHEDFLSSFTTLQGNNNPFASLLLSSNSPSQPPTNESTLEPALDEESLPAGPFPDVPPPGIKLRFDNFIQPVINDMPQRIKVKSLDSADSTAITDVSLESPVESAEDMEPGYTPSLVEAASKLQLAKQHAPAGVSSEGNPAMALAEHLDAAQQALLAAFEQDLKGELKQLHSDMNNIEPLPRHRTFGYSDSADKADSDENDDSDDDISLPPGVASLIVDVEQVAVQAFELDDDFDYEAVVPDTPRFPID